MEKMCVKKLLVFKNYPQPENLVVMVLRAKYHIVLDCFYLSANRSKVDF